jgi:Flp pilus assembly protein CpaB
MSALASRRGRAALFTAAAATCALAAAAVAGGYRASVAGSFGALRPVVVARSDLPAKRVIGPRQLRGGLEVRRVPARFVPPGALEVPTQALGQAPVAPLPAGSYVLAAQLSTPESRRSPGGLPGGLQPLQIPVGGGAALLAFGGSVEHSRVDVIVTTEPASGAHGKTYVAADDVELLGLTRGTATLAVNRAQALRLIEAENFARQVRLLPARLRGGQQAK